jgi:hypothetical protein
MANIPFLTQGYFTTRVGIGTDSPDAQLQVVETTAANIATFENTTQTQSVVNIKTAEVLNNASALTFSVGDNLSSTDIFAEIRGKVVNDGGALKGDLIFITNKGDDGEERMRILANGSVGIGTEDPPQKLTVNGGAFITSNLISPGNIGTYTYNAAAIDYQNNGTRFWSWGNATTRGSFSFIQLESDGQNQQTALTINSAGNVGIGTPSPTRRLEISETGNGNSKEAIFRSIGTNTLGSGSAVSEIVTRQVTGGGVNESAMDIRVRAIGDLFASPNTVMTLEGGGNVGIGTSSPLSNLHIETTNSSAYLQLRRNFTGSKGRLFLGSESEANIIASQGDAVTDAKPLAFQIAETEKMRIDDSGNVGIGETNPGEKLDVKGGNIRLVDASAGLIFTAPNGKLWKQTISNTGVPVYTDVSP